METDAKIYGLTFYQVLKMKEHFDRNDLPYPDERPKRKVKKRFYMMAYKSDGVWHLDPVLVDESFKDEMGYECRRGWQRKIMENSPYIEIEVDE
jgi:hypothetical protein